MSRLEYRCINVNEFRRSATGELGHGPGGQCEVSITAQSDLADTARIARERGLRAHEAAFFRHTMERVQRVPCSGWHLVPLVRTRLRALQRIAAFYGYADALDAFAPEDADVALDWLLERGHVRMSEVDHEVAAHSRMTERNRNAGGWDRVEPESVCGTCYREPCACKPAPPPCSGWHLVPLAMTVSTQSRCWICDAQLGRCEHTGVGDD